MALALLLVMLGFAAAVSSLAPRPRWAMLGFGTFVLLAGLDQLNLHGIPVTEDGDRVGFDILLRMVWLALGIVCGLVALVLNIDREDPGPPLWPLPIGLLVAVLGMHWLSNRLAGATPAGLVHVGVAAVGRGAALALWFGRSWGRVAPALHLLAMVVSISTVLLVGKAAIGALQGAALAERTAGGAPYCLLTFAGRDHPRPARVVLELSSLVSRSGGRAAFDDAHWLVVGGAEGPTAIRFRRFDKGVTAKREPGACQPVAGGNLR